MQKTLHRMFIGVKSCSTIEARGENKDPLSILPFNKKRLIIVLIIKRLWISSSHYLQANG